MIKNIVARFDKKIKKSIDDPREDSIAAEPEEDSITEDSEKTLSPRILKIILSMKNLKRTLSPWNLWTTLSMKIHRSFRTLNGYCVINKLTLFGNGMYDRVGDGDKISKGHFGL